MYQETFGLKKSPFRAKASGADVFVGPQTANIMKSLKKALTASDAVVAVTGVAGVGKSTLVRRALDAIPGDTQVVRIGRMQLAHDEILDFLLEEFGATDIPRSTIRQINLFRELLASRTAAGSRVIVVVEDAVRIGEDALSELESLTAGDADQTDGANLVLMGDESLLQTLAKPSLLRLKQRTRLRHAVVPLTASELLGYLKHCFRLAGNEFDILFTAGCDKALFAHSQGNPRVANNLVEAVLTAAAEQGVAKIDASLISTVATEEFGLTADTTIIEPQPAPAAGTASEPQPDAGKTDEAVAAASKASEPAPAAGNAGEPAAGDEEIPELIQDTLPDLETLAPGLAAQGLVISPESEPPPEAPPEPAAPQQADADDDIPTLFESSRLTAPEPAPEPESAPEVPVAAEPTPALELEPESAPAPAAPPAPTAAAGDTDDKPEWDRDPTLAELRPDIEALEQAMADFGEPEEEPVEEEPEPEIAVELKDPTLPGVPEITLDSAIQTKVDEAQQKMAAGNIANTAEGAENPESQTANLKASPPPAPIEMPGVSDSEKQQKADKQLEKIATDLARAKTLEDVDDKAAETLFGEEFSMLAAQVAASVPDPEAANQDIPAADSTPAAAGSEPAPAPEPQSEMEKEFKEVYGDDALEVSIETSPGGGMDLSASQRLATVRALNADKGPAVGNSAGTPAPSAPPKPAVTPDPIEDQINTSMTQTLKALGARPQSAALEDEDDDDDDTRGGFFSRFRRS